MIATEGEATLYYQYNSHGDVIGVLDGEGALKNEYDYDAFGNLITASETVENPYRYAGYYQDTESGLYYLQSRYYNPETARFLTEDTASGRYSDPLSLNKYTYCHNQPVTGYDPDGHFFKELFFGGLVGGAIGAGKALWDNRANAGRLGLGGMIKTAVGGFVHGAFIGAAVGATFSAGSIALKATKSIIKASAAGFGAGTISGFLGGAAGSAAGQAITTGKIDKQEVLKNAYSTSAGLAVAGAAAPALGVGSKAATKVLGKVLGKAGMSEAMAAGTATVAGMAGEGGAIGSIMGGVGDLAAQGYDIHTGKQSAINWKQTGVSTLTGGLTGFVMGGAFGAFSQTSAGKAFGKWMQEPTKLDIKAAEMVKSFAGNNRGSVNLGAFKERIKSNYEKYVKNGDGQPPENFSPSGAGRNGAFREAKRASGIPVTEQPNVVCPAVDKNGNRIPGRDYFFDNGKTIREHFGHTYPDNTLQNRGKHFNDIYGNHYDYQ